MNTKINVYIIYIHNLLKETSMVLKKFDEQKDSS